jgi:hypothetical protein
VKVQGIVLLPVFLGSVPRIGFQSMLSNALRHAQGVAYNPCKNIQVSAWTGVIFLHNDWYLWPILRHIFVVVVDLAIIAITCDP